MTLQPHQERVIAEHARVAEDTQKLETFTGSDFFRTPSTPTSRAAWCAS